MQKIKIKIKGKVKAATNNRKNIDLRDCIHNCKFCLVTPLGGILCRKVGDYVDGFDYDCPDRT